MTPRIARAIVIAAAAVAVLVAAAGRADPEERGDEPELVLRYLYSPDAEKLLVPLIDRFNGETQRSGGREVRIDGVILTSGEAEAALAARRDRAALWTPASSLWGRLLNHSVSAEWVPAVNPSLVSSPQVIAMWETLARALGWPQAKIGWKDILALATSSRGWAAYGHPEYGPFRLGHTNPGFSTSGLSAVASEYYAVTGKRSNLSLADVRRPDVRASVRTIERSIVHYGETAAALTDQMDRYGQAYAHAVYVQETTVRAFNEQRKQATPLVGIEPADGTFVADYPLIALDAPWVSAEARAAAQCVPPLARPEGDGEERGRERLPPPSSDRPRRAGAAGARGARRDPRSVARGPQARQHRPRRGHVVVDGGSRAPRRRQTGVALVRARALAGGPGSARHLRRLNRDECPAGRAEREPAGRVPRGPRSLPQRQRARLPGGLPRARRRARARRP